MGRQKKQIYPDGTRITWSYDPNGNPTTISSDAGDFARKYNPLDHIESLTWPSGDIVTWSFDPVGLRDYMIDPDGDRTTYTHDAGRLTLLENHLQETTTFTYDDAGRQVQKDLIIQENHMTCLLYTSPSPRDTA